MTLTSYRAFKLSFISWFWLCRLKREKWDSENADRVKLAQFDLGLCSSCAFPGQMSGHGADLSCSHCVSLSAFTFRPSHTSLCHVSRMVTRHICVFVIDLHRCVLTSSPASCTTHCTGLLIAVFSVTVTGGVACISTPPPATRPVCVCVTVINTGLRTRSSCQRGFL